MIDRSKAVANTSDMERPGDWVEAERRAEAKASADAADRRMRAMRIKKGMTTETFRMKATEDDDEGPFKPEPRKPVTAPWNKTR